MSRTYRRLRNRKLSKRGYNCFQGLKYFISEYIYPEGCRIYGMNGVRVFYPKSSKEYKAGVARYHSDSGTSRFKEPGPGWFRKIFKRKYKSKVRKELNLFLRNPDYEVDLHDSTENYAMDYWT